MEIRVAVILCPRLFEVPRRTEKVMPCSYRQHTIYLIFYVVQDNAWWLRANGFNGLALAKFLQSQDSVS